MRLAIVTSMALIMLLVGNAYADHWDLLFLDTFNDGSVTDDDPVSWSPSTSYPGTYTVVGGDYTLTNPHGLGGNLASPVKDLVCDDISIRAQARLVREDDLPFCLGLFARSGVGHYGALINRDGLLQVYRTGVFLDEASVAINPIEEDVMLRLDVVGNTLNAWAWRVGSAMPDEPQVTGNAVINPIGGFGVWADVGQQLSTSKAVFRHVEVYVPEPSTLILLTMGALGLLAYAWRKSF